MAKLNDILFGSGSYEDKRTFIENMGVDALMQVSKPLVTSIVEKAGDKFGNLRIMVEFRKGNHWNSEVNDVCLVSGKLFVDIYVQNTKTDTTMSEYFDKFFRRGEYFSQDNNLNAPVDYKESQKAEVMRSILLQCVYNLFSDENKKREEIAKLGHYSIINPVLNYFYDKYRLRYKDISKYASRDTIAEIKGYHHAERVLREYIENNYATLICKSVEDLQAVYREVFQKAMDKFIKDFDYDGWLKGASLWY